jgi:hypothetical protein
LSAPAQQRDVVLLLNEAPRHMGITACMVPARQVAGAKFCPPTPSPYYFVYGQRMKLEIVNRKFFTTYSITIDAITELTTGQIRNLDEAANITLGAPSFIQPPPAKGGFEQMKDVNTSGILNALIDPTQAAQPEADLRANLSELVREETQIERDLAAFDQELRAISGVTTRPVDCNPLPGARDAFTLVHCLRQECAGARQQTHRCCKGSRRQHGHVQRRPVVAATR